MLLPFGKTLHGGMSIGHKGIIYASKGLGLTLVDLFENASLRADIRKEFEERRAGHVYKAILPDGPPPVPVDTEK